MRSTEDTPAQAHDSGKMQAFSSGRAFALGRSAIASEWGIANYKDSRKEISMAETMRAALDDGTGQYIVQDVPMPEMYEGAAMIRIHQTGICGSDFT